MTKSFSSSLVIALALFFSFSAAGAAEWQLVGKNNRGAVYYDRYGAKQIPGNVMRVPVKIVYSPDGAKEIREAFPFIAQSETVAYTLYTYEVRCLTNSFMITRAATYDPSGKVIKGTELDYVSTAEASWDHATPNSLVSVLSERVCRYLLPARP